MSHHKFFQITVSLILCFSFQPAKAETLKALSLKSTAVLAVADSPDLQKKCGLSPQKISNLSQQLKIKIDKKIDSLSTADFEILNNRANTCELNCSCTVYDLAFEAKQKVNKMISDKASKETATDRLKCIESIKNICEFLK